MTRFALIGLGYWGPNYARVLSELQDAELAWVCDLNGQALELLRRRDPTVKLTTDVRHVLDDPSVDAVIISTPTSTHASLSRSALEAGKHVLCEKPLAARTEECEELVAASEDAGRVLMVGHTFIFNPAVRRMKAFIDAGDIGQVLYCHSTRTGLGPIRQDVNALWDLAPHDISILLYLLGGEPIEVSAYGESYLRAGTEDVVFVNLRLEDRVFANIHLSWLNPYKVRRLTVIGDRRMIVFDDVEADEKLRLFDKGATYDAPAEEARGAEYGEYKAIVRDGDILIPKVPAREPLKEQVIHFLRCCQDNLQPETDAASACRVVQVLEAASESLRSGGAAVSLRRQSPRTSPLPL